MALPSRDSLACYALTKGGLAGGLGRGRGRGREIKKVEQPSGHVAETVTRLTKVPVQLQAVIDMVFLDVLRFGAWGEGVLFLVRFYFKYCSRYIFLVSPRDSATYRLIGVG